MSLSRVNSRKCSEPGDRVKEREFALGIDFGTTHIKATIVNFVNLHRIRSVVMNWTELGLDRTFVCDWFSAINLIITAVLTEQSVLGGYGQYVRTVAISATAPTIALCSTDTPTRGIGGPSVSPIINYDEHITDGEIEELDSRARKSRTEYVVDRLFPLTPSTAGDTVLLSATGLLNWYLTGVFSIDRSSRYELGLSPDDNKVLNAHVPFRRLGCDEPVAEVRGVLCERWGLRGDTLVMAGSSDTFALGIGGALKPGRGLVCLGTFFGLLETDEEMRQPKKYEAHGEPYRWRVASPIGSTIERTAASWYPCEPDTGSRIRLLLEAAIHESSGPQKRCVISYRPWRNNSSVRELPIVTADAEAAGVGLVANSLLKNFATALGDQVRSLDLDTLVVAGGLSRYDRLVSYIEESSALHFESDPRIWAAEGAAVLAASVAGT